MDNQQSLAPSPDSSDDKVFTLALKAALKKLSALNGEKLEHLDRMSQLDSEIAKLRSKLMTLASLVPPSENSTVADLKKWLSELGLTDAVREVLKAHDHNLSPKEVRDWLLRMGFDLSEYSNIQASIHAILKRLHESGEVDRAVDRKSGKLTNLYRWSPFHPSHGEAGDQYFYEIVTPAVLRARKLATKRRRDQSKGAKKVVRKK
jgi:hypothetical protein